MRNKSLDLLKWLLSAKLSLSLFSLTGLKVSEEFLVILKQLENNEVIVLNENRITIHFYSSITQN